MIKSDSSDSFDMNNEIEIKYIIKSCSVKLILITDNLKNMVKKPLTADVFYHAYTPIPRFFYTNINDIEKPRSDKWIGIA